MAALFIVVVALFFIASGYIAVQVCRILKRRSIWLRRAVWLVVALLDLGFFLTRLLPPCLLPLNRVVYVVSTYWLVVVLYGFIVIFCLDLLRWGARLSGHGELFHTPRLMAISATVTLLIVVYGSFVARRPYVHPYTVATNKLPAGESLTVALVSDIHLGYAVRQDDVDKLVKMVNAIGPDLVIIAGDIIDGDLAPVISDDLARGLEGLQSRLGTFAVMGNHEYMDDDAAAESYLRSIRGLHLLRDSAIVVDGLTIVGRDDLSHLRAYGKARAPLADLLPDSMGVCIVVDHQPVAIDEAEEAQVVDLCLSGHTHAGQVWPMKFFTNRIFRLDYGIACFGHATAIVTSGFGTWGPRVRIGNHPEVVKISIEGKGAKQ